MAGKSLTEAIVLCGGAGTRLRPVISDVPKPMADINGRPFLELVLDHLAANGVRRLVMSVGHLRQVIEDYFGNRYRSCEIAYSVEEEPLGTGGALLHSLGTAREETLLAVNGDTYFPIDLSRLASFHGETGGQLTVALKLVEDTGRYGAIQLDPWGRIVGFSEKGVSGPGYINAGVYVVERQLLADLRLPGRFSFERDVLMKLHTDRLFTGIAFSDFFIDIGVPEDYRRVCQRFTP